MYKLPFVESYDISTQHTHNNECFQNVHVQLLVILSQQTHCRSPREVLLGKFDIINNNK